MALSDADLEQLDTYLDGEATPAEAAALRVRLAADAGLAGAAAGAEAARAVRVAVWRGMEPDAAAGDRLLWRVRGALADRAKPAAPRRFAWDPWRSAGVGSAAAACLIVGFLTGRVGRGPVAPTAVPTVAPTGSSTVAQVVPPPGGSAVELPIGTPLPANTVASAGGRPILVPITNDLGQVVSVQSFASPEEAKAYTEALHHATTPSSMSPVPSPVRTVSAVQF